MRVKEESGKSWLKMQHLKNEYHGIQCHHFMARRSEKVETVTDFLFLDSKIIAEADCSHKIKRFLLLGRKVMTNLDSILRSRDITLPTKVYIVKSLIFPESYMDVRVEPWVIWAPKYWCFQTVMLEKTLVSPLDCKEIKPVSPKGNQLWILTGKTDSEAET